MIASDQTAKPVTWEVKKVHQPVVMEAANLLRGDIRITNWHHFTDLSIYDISWELAENGKIIQNGVIESLNTKPAETKRGNIPFEKPTLKPGAEYHLKVIFKTNNDNSWAKKGHIVAWEQFKIPFNVASAPLADISGFGNVVATENEKSIIVQGDGFEVGISKSEGLFTSYKLNGKEIISAPLVPNFWRPPTDNDIGSGSPRRMGVWKDAGKERVVESVNLIQISDKAVRISVETSLEKINSSLSTSYTIYGNGEVLVNYNFVAGGGLPNIPRVGMQMQISNEFDKLEWYGPGPHPTYWDRNLGSAVGDYSKSVKSDFYQYVRPQESNNHWNTRWAKLTNGSGEGIIISAENPLNLSAWPYTMDDIEKAKHINELPDRDIITINIDHLQQGVGGDDSWSQNALPHPEFRIPAKNYSYSFSIKSVKEEGNYTLPKF